MLPILPAALTVDISASADHADAVAEHAEKLGQAVSNSSLDDVTGLVAVTLIFGMPIIIVLLSLWFRHRRQALQSQTALKLAEMGHPIPPELFLEGRQRKSDLSSGLSLIGLGIGLAVGLYFSSGKAGAGFALIPFFMGLARLITWKLEQSPDKR